MVPLTEVCFHIGRFRIRVSVAPKHSLRRHCVQGDTLVTCRTFLTFLDDVSSLKSSHHSFSVKSHISSAAAGGRFGFVEAYHRTASDVAFRIRGTVYVTQRSTFRLRSVESKKCYIDVVSFVSSRVTTHRSSSRLAHACCKQTRFPGGKGLGRGPCQWTEEWMEVKAHCERCYDY